MATVDESGLLPEQMQKNDQNVCGERFSGSIDGS